MQIIQSRRDFLASLSAAGAAGCLGGGAALADEEPPETTTVRLQKDLSNICIAPQYVAEELLRAEGFTDIRYVDDAASASAAEIDRRRRDRFRLRARAATHIRQIDAGEPITVVAGVHPGCFELFAHEPVDTITDLKGKRVGIPDIWRWAAPLSVHHGGVRRARPAKDINWVDEPYGLRPMELFADGKIDAFLGFPPEPQELRARKIGRVILNTATDQPWSQYFCCMLVGNTDFVREYPVATKRVLRAILKAADICAAEPSGRRSGWSMAGSPPRYDYALQTLTEMPYGELARVRPGGHDALLRAAPPRGGLDQVRARSKIIAEGTDWRFLNELKRELKA